MLRDEVYGPVLGNLQEDQVWGTGRYMQAFIYYWDRCLCVGKE